MLKKEDVGDFRRGLWRELRSIPCGVIRMRKRHECLWWDESYCLRLHIRASRSGLLES
jgi:hypothetical protein